LVLTLVKIEEKHYFYASVQQEGICTELKVLDSGLCIILTIISINSPEITLTENCTQEVPD